jgi:hypothetical protein
MLIVSLASIYALVTLIHISKIKSNKTKIIGNLKSGSCNAKIFSLFVFKQNIEFTMVE